MRPRWCWWPHGRSKTSILIKHNFKNYHILCIPMTLKPTLKHWPIYKNTRNLTFVLEYKNIQIETPIKIQKYTSVVNFLCELRSCLVTGGELSEMTANCVSAHFIFCSFCSCAVKNAEVLLHHSLLMVLQTQLFFFSCIMLAVTFLTPKEAVTRFIF